jgi:hypothetical protein
MTREHRITVTNNGAGESMKAHNSFEEGVGNEDGGVGVAQGNEVGIL